MWSIGEEIPPEDDDSHNAMDEDDKGSPTSTCTSRSPSVSVSPPLAKLGTHQLTEMVTY